MMHQGTHFLQIPGPSPVPADVLAATGRQVIDHRGPEFGELGSKLLRDIKKIFKTQHDVVIFPASGTGAWEAALANLFSPGDRIATFETGHFASLWSRMAIKLGLKPTTLGTNWRAGADPAVIEDALRQDRNHEIRAVCIVHNETSTGSTSRLADIRAAIDAANHPALFVVDTISGLASADLRMDEWGIDVVVSGSQKGLMLPPGLSFNAVGPKALEASKAGSMPRSYWDWSEMIAINKSGYFPYTPATNLLFGLSLVLDKLLDEGLEAVFARHERLAEATRRAVQAWGLENLCNSPIHYSPVLTTVMMPEGHSADAYRRIALEKFNMSLGSGLSKVADKVFRIGHLGNINELTLAGTLAGCEMSLDLAGVPHQRGGVDVAMKYLAETA
ncbi:pyridoxal-phosphate-dependent aminotransferase family protein [Aminobacter niigataensis]|uniref:pyridoxal-phosphate-dependent aminotransferase family protein n=1 Tax=Aminobacter niigataensis TaxID=83265 RepID=UPI002283CA59|nr:aminotransferase class V-fold PLP-dependent enzyme [Aminobacter niigataensis]CAI2936643.1 Serine--glyoxylate aminotransferase [Aminobacter niigataensis]